MKQKILRAFELAWAERVKFAKYVIVGVSSVAIDITLLVVLVKFFHLNPTLAVIINQAIVLGFNFTLNKKWSFGSTNAAHKELVRYMILATWNYVFSVIAMYYGNEVLGFHHLLVRIASIMCMTLWNFALFRLWVYRERQEVKNET